MNGLGRCTSCEQQEAANQVADLLKTASDPVTTSSETTGFKLPPLGDKLTNLSRGATIWDKIMYETQQALTAKTSDPESADMPAAPALPWKNIAIASAVLVGGYLLLGDGNSQSGGMGAVSKKKSTSSARPKRSAGGKKATKSKSKSTGSITL